MPIRLIREVHTPGRTGPQNGQYALQRALRDAAPEWLRIGGVFRAGEVPWFWSSADRLAAAEAATSRRPFVAGPNILFNRSNAPRRLASERAICRAASCRLLFTESAWYHDLIRANLGAANRAPIVVWPYPIQPKPGGPLPAEYDVLIYEKSGVSPAVIDALCCAWPQHARIRYGDYQRQELFDLARRSRCCLYCSRDDRGPLALAEILLAGCPVVGLPRGAPFIEPRRSGFVLESLDAEACLEAVSACHRLDRDEVAAWAADRFDTESIVATILDALEHVEQRRLNPEPQTLIPA